MNLHSLASFLAHRDGHGGLHDDSDRAHALYQSSTMAALLAGVYDGDVSIRELLEHGDFGVGTFNHLDGEMVILDGTCFHLHSDGSAETAAPDDLTPFAVVTHFTADSATQVSDLKRADLLTQVDAHIPSANLFYAIRIHGHFRSVKTRTVAAQTKPYPPMADAVKGQSQRTFSDVSGTLAGFRLPDYEQGISVAGYHLHFIDDEHHHGGHVQDFDLARGTVAVETSSEMRLSLPRAKPFMTANLSPSNVNQEIRKTEG